jgi:putative endonuclease
MPLSKYLYVYILRCSDKTYYTGVTNNPEKRLEEHSLGLNKDSYTSTRLPVKMIYCELFTDFDLAITWEKRIKDWSRKKKEALINENWDQLKIAAECKNLSSHKVVIVKAVHVLDSASRINRDRRTDSAKPVDHKDNSKTITDV